MSDPTPQSLIAGQPVRSARLRSSAGLEAEIIEWGASLRDLVVPRADGGRQRVVLGLAEITDYEHHASHMGAIAGRFANRIAGGRFELDGQAYRLPCNENGNSLHGGGQGFGKRLWSLIGRDEASATLALVSPDGDAGYPGRLRAFCRYALIGRTLRLEMEATTDAPTIVNLAHHSYFRLDDGPDCLDHELEIVADVMTPVDAAQIPDGSVVRVEGTPFDFRTTRPVRMTGSDGERVRYDHNFMLRRKRLERHAESGLWLAHAATLRSPASGLAMQIWTTQPALQVYDGYKLAAKVDGLDGRRAGPSAGIALETQHPPDAPNHAHFPPAVLRPGEIYRQVTEFRFEG